MNINGLRFSEILTTAENDFAKSEITDRTKSVTNDSLMEVTTFPDYHWKNIEFIHVENFLLETDFNSGDCNKTNIVKEIRTNYLNNDEKKQLKKYVKNFATFFTTKMKN